MNLSRLAQDHEVKAGHRQSRLRARAAALVVFSLAFPSLVAAQAPAVTAVYNKVSRGAGLSPGGLATIRGMDFGEGVTVSVGGQPAAVLQGESAPAAPETEEEFLYIQLPVGATPGPATLVVTSEAGSSAPFDITLEEFAPALILGASCSAAQPGDTMTVSAIGLGATDPVVPTGTTSSSVLGGAPTVAQPAVTVGGQEAEVLSSVLSTEDIGIYLVTFRVPETEGGQDFALSIGGVTSNREFLGVGRAMFNLSASWGPGPAAPESIRLLHACDVPFLDPNLPPTEPDPAPRGPDFTGDPNDPPTTLGGVTVRVTDSAGVERLAPLFFVDPYQINYALPAGTAAGIATVSLTASDGEDLVSTVYVQSAVPALFPAARIVRLRDGVQTIEVYYPAVQAANGIASGGLNYIDFEPDREDVYLELYGSGWRGRSSLDAVNVDIGGEQAQVVYAGAHGTIVGLDQLNLGLPASLASHAAVEMRLTVDGEPANTMYLRFSPEGIRLETPQPGSLVTSPLTVQGEARGSWYTEASILDENDSGDVYAFPVELAGAGGEVLASGEARAQGGDVFSDDFIPFEATLEFEVPEDSRGTLILHNGNDENVLLRIPVQFR